MASIRDTELYRRRNHGKELSAQEREALVKKYLPTPPSQSSSRSPTSSNAVKTKGARQQRKRRVRPFIQHVLHLLLYHAIQLFFSVYIRLRQTIRVLLDRVLGLLYYHHRTPELIKRDVKSLDRLPQHLSIILHLRGEEEGGIERLMDEVAEIAAWCASAGIPMLSIYEKSGILKSIIPNVHATTKAKLSSYFGPTPYTPYLKVVAPHQSTYSPSPSPTPSTSSQDSLSSSNAHLTLLLLSATDGRDTLVDLTRTLTEMAQSRKISPKDITTDLIEAEITETTRTSFFHKGDDQGFGASSGEPDLLIVFGPYIQLDGYPPWQVRLTEIFCTQSGMENKAVKKSKKRGNKSRSDSRAAVLLEQSSRLAGSVEYQGFLRALWRYAGAEMRFGR